MTKINLLRILPVLKTFVRSNRVLNRFHLHATKVGIQSLVRTSS